MRTLIFILFAISAQAQMFTFGYESVTIKSPDTLSVNESFDLIGVVVPAGYRNYTRYVIKDDKKYMRHYLLMNRIFKRTYLIEDGKKRKRVKI